MENTIGLQKGNWLKIGDNVGKFISMDLTNTVFLDVNGFVYKDLSDNCEPIPIDEQWLFKFEFAILSKSEYISEYIKYFNFRVLKCRIVKNLVFVFIDDHEICMLEYVHQLQNLFYVISGKELKTE